MIVRIICVSIASSNETFSVPWLPFKFTVHIKFSVIYFIAVSIIFWKFWWLIIKFSSSFCFRAYPWGQTRCDIRPKAPDTGRVRAAVLALLADRPAHSTSQDIPWHQHSTCFLSQSWPNLEFTLRCSHLLCRASCLFAMGLHPAPWGWHGPPASGSINTSKEVLRQR